MGALSWLILLIQLICFRANSELLCADSTVEGHTGYLVNKPCNTFCITGYSRNTFLNGFLHIGYAVCNPIGCAKLDDQGNFINDAADRLGSAALGEITVYKCNQESFESTPGALQVSASSGLPCNYYNPQAMSGNVQESAQVCPGLTQVGSGYNDVPWYLEHLTAFIAIICTSIVVLVGVCVGLCLWRRKRAGKSIDPRKAVTLNEGVAGKHFFGLMTLAVTAIMILVFVSAMQPFLLTDVYEIDNDDAGKITGTIGAVEEVWTLLLLGIWGSASDLVGRRLVVCLGYALVALSMFLMPHGKDVYPGLLLIRLVFGTGAAALTSMLTAVLSDVVARESLGIGAGLLGVASGIGALLGVFVFVGVVPASVCVGPTYYVMGGVSLFLMLTCWMLLPSHAAVMKEPRSDELGWPAKLKANSVESIMLLRTRPQLVSSYMAGFAARAGAVIVTSYITLWVSHYFTANDLCELDSAIDELSACHEDLLNPAKKSCPAAYTWASRVSGMAQTFSLVFALIFGMVASRAPNSIQKYLALGSAFGAVVYGLAPVVSNPKSSLMYLFSSLWGVADIAMIVFAQIAVAQEMSQRQELRGIIAGTYSIFGSIGIILITYIGGWLFDSWDPTGPFVLMSVVSFCVMCSALWVCYIERKSTVVEKPPSVEPCIEDKITCS
mmetsp:Transcript_13140/g.21328  ORF Transcript_13140/g.21328 Transcript_13140/m.21328 type:complete len:667 (-) Transcript_13140:215-2215(-)